MTFDSPVLGRINISVFDTHTAGIRPIPNEFPSNKDGLRSLARPGGESNAREWWVPLRVFAGWVCV